jgi:hypothetical protein
VTSARVCVGVASQSNVVTSPRGSKPRLPANHASRLVTSTRWNTGPSVSAMLRTRSLSVGAKFVG